MSTHEIAPDKEHSLRTLANILLIAWGWSILWGGGVFFSAWAIVTSLLFGPPWEIWMVITLILGLVAPIASPIFLGVIITRNWQRGSKAGLGSLLAGVLSFLTVWIGIGVFYEWTSSWPLYFFYSLIISLTACSTIVTFLWLTKTHQYRILDLIAGIVIGIGLTMIHGMMLDASFFASDNMFHLIWQIPPLVWISVVYFPELLAGRSRWTDFVVWALLVLVSFGLPFVVVPLFSMISL